MLRRRLGRTEHESTVAILGGAAFARCTPEEAAAGFADAIAAGVNHLDIAPRYGDAEKLVGPLLPSVRDKLFVACKTTRRNGDGVKAQLAESLQLLRTDTFDLYQMHAVTDLDVLEERMSAAETILSARDEGTVRFAGITGHDFGAPRAFIEALRRFDLDTVMFPVNARMWADVDYRRDAEALLELCAARDVGVMAIKAAARRPWSDRERYAMTWYEPLTDETSIDRGIAFTLSTSGVHAFCTPGDLDVLRLTLAAAERFEPMSDDEHQATIAAAATDDAIFPMPV